MDETVLSVDGGMIMRVQAICGVCLFFVAGLALSGCAKLAHLGQLLTLQSYSDNNDEKTRFIENADKYFEALVEDVKSGRLTRALRQDDIRRAYGAPVYEKSVAGEADVRMLWMYRRQTDYAGKEKVYLYFDERGTLVRWEHEAPDLAETSF